MNPLFTKPSDFTTGEIYKVAVACRSQVCSPYYVEIIDVGVDYITTDLPKSACFRCYDKTHEWFYHITRMKLVGSDEESRKLLLSQKNVDYSDKYESRIYPNTQENLFNKHLYNPRPGIFWAVKDAIKNSLLAIGCETGTKETYNILLEFHEYLKEWEQQQKIDLLKFFKKQKEKKWTKDYEKIMNDLKQK